MLERMDFFITSTKREQRMVQAMNKESGAPFDDMEVAKETSWYAVENEKLKMGSKKGSDEEEDLWDFDLEEAELICKFFEEKEPEEDMDSNGLLDDAIEVLFEVGGLSFCHSMKLKHENRCPVLRAGAHRFMTEGRMKQGTPH
ncbi:hypothetical protein H6P81_000461 [Aristolochia fimbriata]|uniref:Uncharacterized protein n=1 Tax=Aristolochia fimbriata TaxID=158543 RepID=A0AAV7F4N3_ARIFI|nr:hypothetical protein H6P81_000461 [Aristolochia fimbriata]